MNGNRGQNQQGREHDAAKNVVRRMHERTAAIRSIQRGQQSRSKHSVGRTNQ